MSDKNGGNKKNAGVANETLKPKTSFENFRNIEENLAPIIGRFWGLVWGKASPAIDQKTKLLLSLSNAVGAGRIRQATRELVKAYSLGVTVGELDELFELFIWNQGIGNFASEIGSSVLFEAYSFMKNEETLGKTREEIIKEVVVKFGEENPDIAIKRGK